MEENAFLHTIENAIQAIGRGFDVNYDTRLLYCKEVFGSRLVEIDEECRDLRVHERLCVPDVSRDIKCYSEAGGRETTGPYSFSEVWLIF
ncbi:MACPF domain-containing protein CAD1-like protein [Carex littledalei]|uniref:MACPF domain-containing protein CAD1-like protein n=1 Tax=Carex littledalei TaxID=544730 RepID=A0A833QYW2_9POAL|nr:MACPF domain-containing protein CAD1-like protein [Carex littledalei]